MDGRTDGRTGRRTAAGGRTNVYVYVVYDWQDEGWLMGRSVAGKKGVFPANFTKKM